MKLQCILDLFYHLLKECEYSLILYDLFCLVCMHAVRSCLPLLRIPKAVGHFGIRGHWVKYMQLTIPVHNFIHFVHWIPRKSWEKSAIKGMSTRDTSQPVIQMLKETYLFFFKVCVCVVACMSYGALHVGQLTRFFPRVLQK